MFIGKDVNVIHKRWWRKKRDDGELKEYCLRNDTEIELGHRCKCFKGKEEVYADGILSM